MTPSPITIERIPAPNDLWIAFDQIENRGTRGTPKLYQTAGKPERIRIITEES